MHTAQTWRPAAAVLAVALGLALGPTAGAAAAQAGEDPGGQWFSLPIDRGAAQGAEEALAHMAAKRWDLAIESLQDLIEGRPEDLLPDGWGADLERPSQMAHHLGAAAWARRQLTLLPNSAADRYEQRFGDKADVALARALAGGSIEELRAVADRYPISVAGARGLRAAGDLAFAAGQLVDADLTWRRADELDRRLGIHDEAAAEARRLALASIAGDPEHADVGLRLPGPDDRVGPVPSGEREVWSYDLPDNPFAFDRSGSDYPNLVPVVYGDRVFVNTTMNVVCLDAFDGSEVWRSLEPQGWAQLSGLERNDLSKAIDKEAQLVAPAVGSGVVVAAKQIPYAALPNDDYQGFVIMRALPDRRLFAFDAETGERLWRHLPPTDWDGQSGAFAERMSVAGAPIVAGPRVIAPMFRMEGRVDLHVAAFDLRSGELLWSTPVISGQRELNMFNRHEQEYSAPPVRVDGDTVIVATHLGTIAALDLFSGAVRWQATYDQIPLPKTNGLMSIDRTAVWKNAPPVVAGDVVLATPLDSEDLVAIDLAEGGVLWSQPRYSLRPRQLSDSQVDVLIGAGENEVFLGGGWAVSWRKPEGLRSRSQLVPGGLREELGASNSRTALRSPRPILTDEHVLIPGRDDLAALDRNDGEEDLSVGIDWERSERGNLAVGPGLLVSVTNRQVTGFLDLAVLEARAATRLAAAPDDDGAALDLARLLNRRARSEIDVNGYSSRSLALLERARATLDPRVEAGDPELRSELVANLLLEADVRRRIQQPDEARALLERGLAIAREAGQQRDLLLELLPLVRARDVDSWLAALETLQERCADLDVGADRLLADPDWLGFAQVTPASIRPVPAGAWSLTKRALWSEERGRFADALEFWHDVLAGYPDTLLAADVSVGDRAADHIGDLLAAGGRHLYAPFEARAEALLASALERGDGDALDRLPRLFPFAEATLRARQERLLLALGQSDVEALARTVGQLLGDLDPVLDEWQRAEHLTLLAAGLGRAGNLDFERALLARLAERFPDLELTVEPYAGERLSDVVERFGRARTDEAPPARFDQELLLGDGLPGPWHLLGLPPVGANAVANESPRPLIVATDDSLQAFDVDQPDKPLWKRRPPLEELPIDNHERWTLTPSRIVVGSDGLLVAVDVSSGRAAWVHAIGRGRLRAVASTAGVVIAQVLGDDHAYELIGLDAVGGAPLWSRPLPAGPGWCPPVADDGHAVVLERETVGPTQAWVVDPFTGELRGTIELPDKLGSMIDRAPWIQGDRLLLPSLLRGRLAALDLDRLVEAWSIDLGDDRDLRAVLTYRERVFVVAEGNGLGDVAKRGAIIEVDPRVGSRRTVYSLDRDDRMVGLRRGDRIDLAEPLVFTVAAPSGDERARVTTIDLDRGRRWIQELATTEAMLFDPNWARAVVSETTVALFYAQRAQRNGSRQRVWLDLFDREDGTRLGRRQVAREYEAFQSLTPLAIGSTLWLGCKSPRGSLDRIDLWRNE